jgi:hypothetical protein
VIKRIHSEDGNGVCMRVSLPDIMEDGISDKINNILNTANLDSSQVDLLLDLEHPSKFDPILDFSFMILSVLNSTPLLDEWRSLILSSSSFPATKEITQDVETVERKEWLVYQNLIKQSAISRIPIYSDYTIVSPGHVTLDFRTITRKCYIKYTIENNWMILRGKRTSKTKPTSPPVKGDSFMKDYHGIANEIVNSNYYFGKDYSQGDLRLFECSEQLEDYKNNKKTKPGSASNWIEAGVNHHITKVVNDLSSIHET